MSLIVVNINVHSNNNSSNSAAPQGPDRPPADGSGKHASLIDWFWGTALAYWSDPYMATVRTYMVDLLVKWGEKPELAPATAILISSAVLCAAPVLLRWVVRKFFS